MGRAWHNLEGREFRTEGANVGDNINMVIKVTGHIREKVKMKINIILFNYTKSTIKLIKLQYDAVCTVHHIAMCI